MRPLLVSLESQSRESLPAEVKKPANRDSYINNKAIGMIANVPAHLAPVPYYVPDSNVFADGATAVWKDMGLWAPDLKDEKPSFNDPIMAN